MSNEKVLFDDRSANITVTNERLIVGEDVFDIGAIKHAAFADSNGLGDYLIPIAFAIVFGLVGIPLLFSFSAWSILGLILLLCPVSVFRGLRKKMNSDWWVFIYLRSSGDAIEEEGGKRRYPRDVAKRMSDAINASVQNYRIANDPRKNLAL